MEITPQPIAPAEAQEIMRNDVVALVSKNPICPLAKAIADALVALERAIEAHKPE